MEWILVLLIFVFGSIIGSFINVVISRTISGEDWVRGRSRCDYCHEDINWYDNIPLLSYLFLRGKCRYCHKEISIQHPVVEFLTGTLFVWWYGVGFAFFQLTQQPLHFVQPAFWLIIGILLLIILITDWVYMIIPDYAVAGIGGMALLYRVYLVNAGVMQPKDLWLTLISGFVASFVFLLLWAATKGKGLGFGDVKYALVMGWLLGWPRLLVGIFTAFVAGGLIGSGLLLTKKKKLKAKIAFGPFLVLGTVIALVWGMPIWEWYMGLLR